MVFQQFNLFPQLTALENVAFGPSKVRGLSKAKAQETALDLLEKVGLRDKAGHYPAELSGGQQQRVAIARALVFEPDLLLLDEPLAALDRKLREEMQLEFRRIQKELGVTTINVTHDQREALVVSDQIIVMDHGTIQQDAAPADMYRVPGNPFVANFIGVTNVFAGQVTSIDDTVASVKLGEINLAGTLRGKADELPAGTPVQCALRAEQIRIASQEHDLNSLDFQFQGTISDVIFEGERQIYEVSVPELSDNPIRIFHHDQDDFATHDVGALIHLGWTKRDMHIYAEKT